MCATKHRILLNATRCSFNHTLFSTCIEKCKGSIFQFFDDSIIHSIYSSTYNSLYNITTPYNFSIIGKAVLITVKKVAAVLKNTLPLKYLDNLIQKAIVSQIWLKDWLKTIKFSNLKHRFSTKTAYVQTVPGHWRQVMYHLCFWHFNTK